MVDKMVREFFIIIMVIDILVIGKTIYSMDLVYMSFLKERDSKVNCRMVKNQVRESIII